MGMNFSKICSILIASGNSQKIGPMVASFREFGFDKDEVTKKSKTFLIKYGKDNFREAHFRTGSEMYKLLMPVLEGVDKHYFCYDRNDLVKH